MDQKRFNKQTREILNKIGFTLPKSQHLIIGANDNKPMSLRAYITDEDMKEVTAGKGRNDHRYVTIDGNFQNDELVVALRFDLSQPEGEQAMIGTFSGPRTEKLNNMLTTIMAYLINGTKPALQLG